MTQIAKRIGVKMSRVSLGKGQISHAEASIRRCAESGGWVLLENCHLVPEWMPHLARIYEDLEKAMASANESAAMEVADDDGNCGDALSCQALIPSHKVDVREDDEAHVREEWHQAVEFAAFAVNLQQPHVGDGTVLLPRSLLP